MKLKRLILPAMLSVALGITALPATAQQRGEQRDRGSQAGQRAAPRQEGRQPQAAPQARQPEQRETQPRQAQPNEQRRGQQRGEQDRAEPRPVPRQVQPRQGGERADSARGIYNGRRDDERGRERERRGYVTPRVAPYRPYYYARPFYAFRPRFNLGFGLWLGYAVPYPYYGYDVSSYPAPYEVPPPPPDAIEVQPGEAYGGLSFDITPDTAAVYVDGEYAGQVADFVPDAQPLTVGAGRHHLEIDAPGYRPMVFDVDIEPGQVIPYQGAMMPY